MKFPFLLLLLYFFPVHSSAQTSLVDVYNAHTFPCDSAGTTVEINICSGVKLEFADSLLNFAYRKIIKSLNNYIANDKKEIEIEQIKKDTGSESKEYIQSLFKDIDYNQRLKKSIIKSQQQWIKVRDLNYEVTRITCEGGTACTAISNQSLIDDALDRIKKLESFEQ